MTHASARPVPQLTHPRSRPGQLTHRKCASLTRVVENLFQLDHHGLHSATVHESTTTLLFNTLSGGANHEPDHRRHQRRRNRSHRPADPGHQARARDPRTQLRSTVTDRRRLRRDHRLSVERLDSSIDAPTLNGRRERRKRAARARSRCPAQRTTPMAHPTASYRSPSWMTRVRTFALPAERIPPVVTSIYQAPVSQP